MTFSTRRQTLFEGAFFHSVEAVLGLYGSSFVVVSQCNQIQQNQFSVETRFFNALKGDKICKNKKLFSGLLYKLHFVN